MRFEILHFLGLAALAAADNDPPDNNSSGMTSGTQAGIPIQTFNTETMRTTDTSVHPVVTTERNTMTNVATETGQSFITLTSGTSTTVETVRQTMESVILGAQSGYKLSTLPNGATTVVPTQSDAAPYTATSTVAAQTGSMSTSTSPGAAGHMATAMPMVGAAMAGVAAFVL